MYDLPPHIQCPEKAPFVSTILRSFEIKIGGLAVVVKIPPAKKQDETYQELVCTDQDKANITEIIKTMGENGKLSLLFKQTHLKQLGAQINHVHPLKFLGIVFSNSELTAYMREIFNDYFKRTGFLDGLGPSLSREMEKGKLNQYIEDFAKEIGRSSEGMNPYFQGMDWEALMKFLLGE